MIRVGLFPLNSGPRYSRGPLECNHLGDVVSLRMLNLNRITEWLAEMDLLQKAVEPATPYPVASSPP